MPWDTAEFLINNFDDFDDEPHKFTLNGTPIDFEDLLVDPQLYIAEVVRTRGRVMRAHSTPPEQGVSTQLLVFTDGNTPGEAYCSVTSAANATRFRAGQVVDIRAVVTAWGTWASRDGDETQELALTCSAARLSRSQRLSGGDGSP